jgi:hypothetical protein
MTRLASTVYQVFLASDDASVTLAGLKRIHGLMPYMLLKGALKVTNPVAMIRSTRYACLETTSNLYFPKMSWIYSLQRRLVGRACSKGKPRSIRLRVFMYLFRW